MKHGKEDLLPERTKQIIIFARFKWHKNTFFFMLYLLTYLDHFGDELFAGIVKPQ